MNMEVSRRRFIQGATVSLAGTTLGTTLGALGFGDVEIAYAATIRAWKLTGTTETRNTCTYCAVGCGIIMYANGNLAKGEKADSLPETHPWTSPKGIVMSARFLRPVPITRDNLNVVIEAGWIAKAELCQNVSTGRVKACD